MSRNAETRLRNLADADISDLHQAIFKEDRSTSSIPLSKYFKCYVDGFYPGVLTYITAIYENVNAYTEGQISTTASTDGYIHIYCDNDAHWVDYTHTDGQRYWKDERTLALTPYSLDRGCNVAGEVRMGCKSTWLPRVSCNSYIPHEY